MSETNQIHQQDVSIIDSDNEAVIKIAIIGGGLTGLFTATLLEREFAKLPLLKMQITIFEKSRSVGRLATRYRTDEQTGKNWQWSFGAQFFTAKSDSFKAFIAPWIKSELVQPWQAQVVALSAAKDTQPLIEPKEQWGTQQARYISTPKMTSWGRQLADELRETTIQFKTRVAPLAQYSSLHVGQPTELFAENGERLGHFDWVICTAPNAQAAELMADTKFSEYSKIMQPKMLACYTLMLGWDDESKVPDSLNFSANSLANEQSRWDVAYVQESIIDRLFVEHNKPNHDQLLPSVTVHADNRWSEQQVDEDIEQITTQLLTTAKQALKWNEQSAPSQIDCHRWRYAATVMSKNSQGDKERIGLLVDKEQHWIVSGDWCGQGNIESCYLMAQKTAEIILSYQRHNQK